MLLVQNSLRYVNMMTFESILILLNFKHGAQRSLSEACSLKKCTLPYIYFVFKSLVLYFGIKKGWLEKKFEYFFIGSEHP